jgi:hypothetical protein
LEHADCIGERTQWAAAAAAAAERPARRLVSPSVVAAPESQNCASQQDPLSYVRITTLPVTTSSSLACHCTNIIAASGCQGSVLPNCTQQFETQSREERRTEKEKSWTVQRRVFIFYVVLIFDALSLCSGPVCININFDSYIGRTVPSQETKRKETQQQIPPPPRKYSIDINIEKW